MECSFKTSLSLTLLFVTDLWVFDPVYQPISLFRYEHQYWSGQTCKPALSTAPAAPEEPNHQERSGPNFLLLCFTSILLLIHKLISHTFSQKVTTQTGFKNFSVFNKAKITWNTYRSFSLVSLCLFWIFGICSVETDQEFWCLQRSSMKLYLVCLGLYLYLLL